MLKLNCCNKFLSTCQDEAREEAEAAKVDIVGGVELVSKVTPYKVPLHCILDNVILR